MSDPDQAGVWWTAVIITASSARQAARYQDEIERRRHEGKLPRQPRFLVVPDVNDQRIGSGGATINALRHLAMLALPQAGVATLHDWWQGQRVLVVHSGGDSRRLPQFSTHGKLFSVLPMETLWGDATTVFDEIVALSTAWAQKMSAGLAVCSGDVLLALVADTMDWNRPGICGVAMPQSVDVGSQHGVYVLGQDDRVYAFLQKPSLAEVQAYGGLLPDGQVALDTGVLRFDPSVAAELTRLGGVDLVEGQYDVKADPWTAHTEGQPPSVDLYEHITRALTGQWQPEPNDGALLNALAGTLSRSSFSCELVTGTFTHVGTTRLFRDIMTEGKQLERLYRTQQRLGSITAPGVKSHGVILDSELAGGAYVGPQAVVLDCSLRVPLHVERGAIAHGIEGMTSPVRIPEEVVAHQLPVEMESGARGSVVRVYGVSDDPKASVQSASGTWFGQRLLTKLSALGIDAEEVWPDGGHEDRTLWNARLFVVADADTGWKLGCWFIGEDVPGALQLWRSLPRLSLAESAFWADVRAMSEAANARLKLRWRAAAVSLSRDGSDIRPILVSPPDLQSLAEVGRTLRADGEELRASQPTTAASRHFHASMFLRQAGLAEDAVQEETEAFACVQHAVALGLRDIPFVEDARAWARDEATVYAPARIDLGGGWSDTPPFCLDWGGTVLNVAVTLDGAYPISTTIRRIEDPIIRCIADGGRTVVEYQTTEELLCTPEVGCPHLIPRMALQKTIIARAGQGLSGTLSQLGGGLEIETLVNLPMGSGLGTSSILAATVLKALALMLGCDVDAHQLSDHVLHLEQMMTTGGGWQDQVGGIFPGAKLTTTGPGSRQRLRVQPLTWSVERQQAFSQRLVLCYTGIQRVARNLLAQVVGRYLAREVATVQVLHSIKTLATEMSFAIQEGEWDHLGQLLDRHWELNQILDPATTNAPINHILSEVRPYLAGAKLAGAGGGGFMVMVAKTEESTALIQQTLSPLLDAYGGRVYAAELDNIGMVVR